MRGKRFLIVAVGLLVVASLALPGSISYAAHRIQDTGRGTVSLDRTGDAPEQATGTARFRLTDVTGGFHNLRTRLTVRNLNERAGRVFNVWLRDTDDNYDLDLGAFQTDNTGDGHLSVRRPIVHLAEYDEVLVSSEPKHDNDPRLNGPILLKGKLH